MVRLCHVGRGHAGADHVAYAVVLVVVAGLRLLNVGTIGIIGIIGSPLGDLGSKELTGGVVEHLGRLLRHVALWVGTGEEPFFFNLPAQPVVRVLRDAAVAVGLLGQVAGRVVDVGANIEAVSLSCQIVKEPRFPAHPMDYVLAESSKTVPQVA